MQREPRYDETEVVSMTKKIRNIAAVVTALVLVMALAVPAVAAPGAGKLGTQSASSVASSGPNAEQRLENLQNRIANVLRARKARFDAVAANLVKRQDRVEALAAKVETLGGDVTKVRAQIAESVKLLEQARVQEQACVNAFQEVPEATNRGAAFRAAKAEGRESVQLMKQSRVRLRDAAGALARIAEGLATEE